MHKVFAQGARRTGLNFWGRRKEEKMNRKHAGFTFYELMVVIAIIAVLSAIAVPNMIGWRERAKIKGAFENLRGDLQWAKIRAIRDHDPVAVVFEADSYDINDASGGTIRSRQMPAGVVLNLGASTIPQNPDNLSQLMTLFDTRGRCQKNSANQDTDGLLVLEDSSGEQRQIRINPLGQIRQE
ncbi:MAG: GspH/FimT family pseudopilin [Desulfobacterales bacterium]